MKVYITGSITTHRLTIIWNLSLKLSSENFLIEISSIIIFFTESMRKKFEFRYVYLQLTQKSIFTACSYHVTYAFQSQFTLYSCLNVKELVAWNRRDSNKLKWSLSEVWPVWPNGWVFVYEPSAWGFESTCSHLKVSYLIV